MSTAVVIQHVPHEGPGWLAELFADADVQVDVRRMYDGAPLPSVDELDGLDGLVVLGGPMGAYDDDKVPWLAGVLRLLVDAVAAGKPTLGICLGAQLLAVAGRGEVAPGDFGPELGLGTLRLTAAAADDPLFRGVATSVQTVQWHWDTVTTLPDGAVLLASSPSYANQAFRVGPRAWGMQFHPEVTVPMVAQWAQDDGDGVRAAGLDPATVVGAVAGSERLLLETWSPVLERFAALLD